MTTATRQIASGAAALVETFAQSLKERLGDNLVALIVSGEATRPDFVAGRSAIDSLLLLGRVDAEALAAVRESWQGGSKKGLQPPVVLTPKALHDALDVFPVEFLLVRETGVVATGEYDVAAMAIERADLRLQCERELRGMALHTRLAAIRFGDSARDLGDWLLAGSGKLDMILQAVEFLATGSSTPTSAERLDVLCRTTGVECHAFQVLYELRGEKRPRVEIGALIQLEQTLTALVAWVDAFNAESP